MARVIWSREALLHLELIAEYIEQFDPDASRRFALRLFEAGESLREFPHRGRLGTGGRRVLSIVWPYRIRYRVDGETVLILDIRHGRRNVRS